MITTTLQSCEIITQKKQLIREASFGARRTLLFIIAPNQFAMKKNSLYTS